MKLTSLAAAAIALGLTLGAAGAYAADEPETGQGCMNMDKNATAAMNSNLSSSNLDAVRQEIRQGRNNCNIGFYRIGIAHYKKALSLLNTG